MKGCRSCVVVRVMPRQSARSQEEHRDRSRTYLSLSGLCCHCVKDDRKVPAQNETWESDEEEAE